MMKKKILIALAVLAAIIIITVAAVFILFVHEPNLFFDVLAEEIKEGQTKEITFEYEYDEEAAEDDSDGKVFYNGFPVFKFAAPESAAYTVSITDVKSDADVFINLSVVDDNLEDLVSADNYDRAMNGLTDSVTADVQLQESRQCYILIETAPGNESVQKYTGSLKLTLSRAAEGKKPPQLSVDESVRLKVAEEEQVCAVFTPQETGYYRFDTSIVNSRTAGGYSLVSSVTGQDKLDIELTEGICLLEQGKEYYVWVAVYETGRKSSRVKLSCAAMNRETVREKGEVHIKGDTVIEYLPVESGNIAVYSVTDGDPKAIIYEKAGFPLRTDDDTETSLSDNPDDFAVVFTVESGGAYRICVFGEITDGSIIITDYTGDGSSLTPDDIAPVQEPEVEAELEEKAESEAETDAEEEP